MRLEPNFISIVSPNSVNGTASYALPRFPFLTTSDSIGSYIRHWFPVGQGLLLFERARRKAGSSGTHAPCMTHASPLFTCV